MKATKGKPKRYRLYYFSGKYYLIRFDLDKNPVGISIHSSDRPDGTFGPELGGEYTGLAVTLNLQILSKFEDEILWLGDYEEEETALDQMKTTKEIRESLEEIVEAYSNKRVGKQTRID